MNGQAAQISTSTSVQYERLPLSQSVLWLPSRLLTIPSGCSMVRQTVATTKDGSTYGIRNTALTSPRPRYLFWVTSAAAIPIGTVAAVGSSANETLIHIEGSSPESSDSA